MGEEALKKSELEPDNSEETEVVVGEEGYGDKIEVVVPIRDDLQEVVLAQLKDDLVWNQSIVNSGNANDSPTWTKRVKNALRTIPGLKLQIAKIEAKNKK